MPPLGPDVRYALRAFRRAPGFTLAAVLSLAVGVGANTAIFSVVRALLLRPLPYADADRLAILWNTSPGLGITEDWFSTAQYVDIKTSVRSFEQVAIAIGGNTNLTGGGSRPERIGTVRVSSNLLPMLGARPALGRLFDASDDVPGRIGAAVLSHGTWLRRYGGNPAIVGTAIVLDGKPYEVRGVLAEGFDLPREVMPTLGGAEHAEILVPLPLAAEAATVRNGEDYNILARLRDEATLDTARAELATLTARLVRDHPDFYPPNGGLTFVVRPLHEQVVGSVRRALLVLTVAVACVLLIACANVAGLLLSRALGRQREIALRTAIGASRRRIVRQLLTESLLLAVAGGLAGFALSALGLQAIRLAGAASVPRLHEIGLDGPMLMFTLAVSLAAGIVFGLAPALRLSRLDSNALKDAGRGSSGAGTVWATRHRLRRVLVAGELALAVVLLVGAGLLMRSFSHLLRVPPGFDPANVLTFEITLTGQRYADVAAVHETYERLWERLAALPGVTAAGGITALPLSRMMAWGPITVEGRVPAAGEKFLNADQRTVSGDYFQAMRIELIEGRLFTDHDVAAAPRVVVIDQHMARELWPNESPIGKRLRTGGFDATASTPWLTVVGVVARVKQDALDSEPRIAFYRAHRQSGVRALTVVVRSATEPASLTAAVRDAVAGLDPDLPIYRVRSMQQRVDESLAQRRFAMLLLAVFAGVALGLALMGTYAIIATLVNQGTREIGIRMALGATRGQILSMVVGQGAAMAAAGIVIGLGLAAWATGFLQSLLFGVKPTDPITFAAIGVLLILMAALASYVPARRAARLDPMTSLRSE
jgi:predicted permease